LYVSFLGAAIGQQLRREIREPRLVPGSAADPAVNTIRKVTSGDFPGIGTLRICAIADVAISAINAGTSIRAISFRTLGSCQRDDRSALFDNVLPAAVARLGPSAGLLIVEPIHVSACASEPRKRRNLSDVSLLSILSAT